MNNTVSKLNYYKQSVFKITFLSFVSLLLGLTMLNAYISNILLNLIGLLATSYFIYYNTLRKQDVFSFIMIMYFCSLFPYLQERGGGFNLVAFTIISMYLIINGKLPGEISIRDKWFKWLSIAFLFSSILGWITIFTGEEFDILYSVISFLGVMALLSVAGKIIVTEERIKIFIKLNIVLITYATIASLNKYLKFISVSTPLLPIYGEDGTSYFEGGGTIGSSPYYGEHSLILAILFAVFLLLYKRNYLIKKSVLIFFLFLSIINVFMSISRSTFLLTIFGLVLILLFQFKIVSINLNKLILQASLIIIIGFAINIVVQSSNLGYTIDRLEQINQSNQDAGGLSIDGILDGSAFNRQAAFEEAYKKYNSRFSWLIGYGWGLTKNNRDAFYVNTTINRGSAHSQIFAILFIFGWIGFVAYFGLIIRAVSKSYKIIGKRNYVLINRIVAYFFMIAFILFLINEIKVDSVSMPGYFAATMILLGLAYSNISTTLFSNKNKEIVQILK